MVLLVPTTPVEPAKAAAPGPNALHVKIRREPFSPTFVLILSTGNSEEVDCGTEAVEWFKSRGANMLVVEKALDYAYNFYHADLVIGNPRTPGAATGRVHPRL